MSNQLTIAHGAVTAKLVNPTREQKLIVQDILSYTVDGFEHMPGMAGRGWDGKASFFDFVPGTFPRGFAVKVFRHFSKLGTRVSLVRNPLPLPLGPENPKVDAFPEDPRYDYQSEAVLALLRHGQIVARIATGGGKSRVAKLVYSRIGRKTLFLTTRGILMHQMKDAFIADLGIGVGVYGDDEWSRSNQLMNVGMVQTFAARMEDKTVEGEMSAIAARRGVAEEKMLATLVKRLEKQKLPREEISQRRVKALEEIQATYPPAELTLAEVKTKVAAHAIKRAETIELLKSFEVLILEEAHEAGGNSYYNVARACSGAHYRIALTATPDMRDSDEANLRLEAVSGPVGIHVSEKTLIDRGILAKPYFKYAQQPGLAIEGYADFEEDGEVTERITKLFKSTPYQRAYEIGISGGIERNEMIVREVVRAKSLGLTTMILLQHMKHGNRLVALLTAAGVRCNFIKGEHSQDERAAGLAALRDGRIDCLIGSTILDVGVDAPAVGLIILAGGGKAEVANRQRIGRGLRAKKKGANVCFVLDFEDRLNNHLRDHSRERRRIVESTPGFAEGIVSDFPYQALGFGATMGVQ